MTKATTPSEISVFVLVQRADGATDSDELACGLHEVKVTLADAFEEMTPAAINEIVDAASECFHGRNGIDCVDDYAISYFLADGTEVSHDITDERRFVARAKYLGSLGLSQAFEFLLVDDQDRGLRFILDLAENIVVAGETLTLSGQWAPIPLDPDAAGGLASAPGPATAAIMALVNGGEAAISRMAISDDAATFHPPRLHSFLPSWAADLRTRLETEADDQSRQTESFPRES